MRTATTIPSAGRRRCCRSCRATHGTSTRCVHIIDAIVDRESDGTFVVLRDRPAMGQVDHLRPRPLRRLARRAVRRGPVHLRRRVDGRRRRRRSRASSTSRAPSTCRSSISSTARASSSGCKPSKRARSATGRGHWPRSARARRRIALWSSGRRSVSREPRTGGPAASTTGARGRRATGARCRSRAASRSPTRPSSRRPRTATRILRRSGLASTECARRSEAPKRSTSRTSSIRATRVPSCAGGPTSSHACGDQDRARCASAR